MSDTLPPGPQPTNAFANIKLPDQAALKRLAISESGFVFDPGTGHSFTVNETGMMILHELQKSQPIENLLQTITDEYHVSLRDAERDVLEFLGTLRKNLEGQV